MAYISRRSVLALIGSAALAQRAFAQGQPLPIVFVHGNGDTAGLWLTTLWRFESNGYSRGLLHAVDLRYPQARAVDATPQPGRSSAAEVMGQLREEVAEVRKRTGAAKVILIGQSRGCNTVRNYIKNGGGAEVTALAILTGGVNHGVIVSDKALVGSEFNGNSDFMKDLNSTSGEVVPGVRFVTIRSLDNDKFAQPDGRFLGMPGVATGVGFDGPELKGAENIIIPKIDHRETGYGPEAFLAMWKVITGGDAAGGGRIAGSSDPTLLSGMISSFEAGAPTNMGLAGARVTVYRASDKTGERRGEAIYSVTTGSGGRWGPCDARDPVEIVIEAAGYPITHMYRSGFPRSSDIVHLRPQLFGKDDAQAGSVVYLARPRGYFGEGRGDVVELGGKPAEGIPKGVATVSTARLALPEGPQQTVIGRFNDETIAARTWPVKENRVTVIELTW
jgi:triacylglycerol lipase